MFLLATLAVLLVSCQASIYPSDLRLDERIVGGTPIQIAQAPYQVALLIDSNNIGVFYHSCGGSIINRNVVLTGAQCLNGTFASRWQARVGSTYHNSGGQVIPVKSYFMHELFNSRLEHDIALIYLSGSIVTGAYAEPAILPYQDLFLPESSYVYVTGWGLTLEGGSQPQQLQAITVPVVTYTTCKAAYNGYNPVTDNMLCAGIFQSGGQDSCAGDTGGPMTNNGVLYGITSWGRGCGRPQSPTVFTKVSKYVDWIYKNTYCRNV